MRPSNKSRQRKNNNRRQNPNVNAVNRVFDSSGPSGKVRGTPQQIVEKYAALAGDATLAGDRVAAENYQQHSEHYSRMLTAALKEQADKQAEHQKQQLAQQQAHQARQQREASDKSRNAPATPAPAPMPDIMDDQPPMAAVETKDTDLVETPESSTASKPKSRSRTRQAAPKTDNTAAPAPVSE
ncbi:MAG: DUF4167 domain-containing protein [Rhodobacteraceae bacterium]|nr:DUF4167 domain-containing protein [Paracoccaceae bacterium]